MPGFVGHTAANTLVLAGTTAVMWSQGWSIGDIVAVDAGVAISTLILSPDMDLFTSKPMDDWGILRIFWWPYAKIVKHRDRLHTPLLGTLVRWLYTMVVVSVAVVPFVIIGRRMNLKVTFGGDAEDIQWYLGYVFDMFLGANLADAMHFVLDEITTGIKRGMGPHHRDEQYPLASEHHGESQRDRPWQNERGRHS